MTPARVLLVDDSVVARRSLGAIVESDPRLQLLGSAATASIAFQKLEQNRPDVVVLDVEMPDCDGIEAAARIRRAYPDLPVLMCSALTERGGDVTLRALAAGATDCIAKPSTINAHGGGLAGFKAELVEKLCALTGRPALPFTAPPPPEPIAAPRALVLPRPTARVSALAIGCSTGGPNALAELFSAMRAPLPLPVFVVQHMPPVFTRMLAERLTANTGHQVSEAVHGELAGPGRVYVAPGGFHLSMVREALAVRLLLNQDPPENSCRPAVDVMFRAAANCYRDGLVAAVLTGMGHDGTWGARAVVDQGGLVMVQRSDTCVVPSMPSSVAEAGLSTDAYTLPELALHLARRAHGEPEA